MPVLGKKIRNTKELLGHLPHRTQMIASTKLLIAFLDFYFFLMCFKVIKLGELNFRAYSTVVESAKKNFLIIRLHFLILCVNFLFFLCYCYYHLKQLFPLVFTASIHSQTIIISYYNNIIHSILVVY